MHSKGKIYIGTSGWNYKHWKGNFYPENITQKNWFNYYFEKFKTVELNSSFYRLPARSTFEKWREITPEDFVFSIKAYRYFTHMKKLINSEEMLNKFFDSVNGLGNKAGPILFQMPPGFRFNLSRLADFINKLSPNYNYTFEFRNPDWWNEETYSLLKKNNIAFCIHQIAGNITPMIVTTQIIYIRLHGPTQYAYTGYYDNQTLKDWTKQISEWRKQGKEIYCYFDNDEKGYAALNALELQELTLD